MKWNEAIRKLRKENKYTQEGLGKILGVSRELVSNWELGKRTPTMETFMALSRLFNVPIQYFTGYTEQPDAQNLTKQVEIFFMADDVTQEIKDKILQDIMEIYWGNKDNGKSEKKSKGDT